MDKNIKSFIVKYQLDRSFSIVAVSGGVDSVVLLELMSKYLSKKNFVVAHVNHGLRKSATKEAKFVETLAKDMGVPYFETSLRLEKKDEASARDGRYRFLRQISKKVGAKYIVTAHHLDDQIETVLLNLVRGTGPLQIWGMKEAEGDVLRPFLSITKKDILDYAHRQGLSYHEDESNQDMNYARNRLRHQVIPELYKINPGFNKTIDSEIRLGQEAEIFLNNYLDKIEKEIVKDNKINIQELKKQPPYIAKEIVKRTLHKNLGRKQDIYQKNINTVLGLIELNGSKKTRLGNLIITKNYKQLVFGIQKEAKPKSLSLPLGKWVKFGPLSIRARIGTAEPDQDNILLPTDFSGNLRVRTWRAGDKIRASFGTKKIQDVFTDAKIDKDLRRVWPIVTHKNTIVWVPRMVAGGHRVKKKNNLIIEVK